MMAETVPVYIGLGSNLDGPRDQLRQAIQAIERVEKITLKKISSFYHTAAVGPAGQPDYLNAVALLETRLSAEKLLDELQKIESSQGRIRQERWGARTLDLDILMYGNEKIRTSRLTVPHEHMLQRNFVLIPLQEIAGDSLVIPGDGLLGAAIKNCPDNPIEKREESQE